MIRQRIRPDMLPKLIAGLIILLVLIFPVFTTNQMILSMLIMSGILAIGTMGFTIVLKVGQFSLGQASFMAIGAYSLGIILNTLHFPFWPSFLSAGIISGIFALLIGLVVLRVGGIYFSIITLAVGELVRIVAENWEAVTGGVRGLTISPPETITLGSFELNFSAGAVPFYYFMIVLVAITSLVVWQIGRVRIGETFYGVAANPVLVEHHGVDPMKYRTIAFTVAGALTGFAGALYGSFQSVITPGEFGLWQSVQLMMMSVVGGLSNIIAGGIVGAIVLYTLSSELSSFRIYGIQPLLFGAAVILALLFLPKGTGLIDIWGRVWQKVLAPKAGTTNMSSCTKES